ncbi:MAG: hypothetical protein NPINA01_06530 [Nitrospinaceae bacterium]|nr:MAG: hypothetical protein NPINA01_06530 [Nitrospinaceae bacterium]
MPTDFKSLLPPKFIPLLEHKLETGELSPEECKEIIKEMMLREYELTQSEKTGMNWKAWRNNLRKQCHAVFGKFRNRPPTEPTLGMEELTATIRPRQI